MINTEKIKMLILDVDGTMTDGRINVTEEGQQFKQFHARDGLGIRMLIKKGIRVGIVSHSFSGGAIQARGQMLGVSHIYTGLEEKDEIIEGWCSELDLDLSEIAFIGDDLNDIPAMKKVGISACPADAADEVVSYVDLVLKRNGGDGCIREFIDKYMTVSYSKMA
ncbi:HAD-IIIA family hydrolase [Reichenbachiella carrageenanivorans]|uniref:HAD-IIIA family hydrolase n=1 Tax=Reichenbachiella carrageenanivorans TaxID=2979869 RepID=A0ABY6CX69_9BACT|nr:HAD-IIIA family hydrolase [Reichenbachiella carrageenanivorans]UXX77944.1 HAD-IIIA family hydrolase [Reichenbachiella carrageenanivorans]